VGVVLLGYEYEAVSITASEFEFLGGIRTMSISENTNTSIKVMDCLLRLANIDQDE
jgi:hypothetical protein